MKLQELRLLAYGPFTGVVVDMRQGSQGLHIVYGPNEAGKSSALRALRYLLYGIPERTRDDFLHPYTKMRIGAVVAHSNGTSLEFVRRKGRGNTLRAGDDRTLLEESRLEPFLGGVDADFFATMFAIDHADLVRGGREILQGGGRLGRIIFAAGSGLSSLRGVQEELQAQADLLFKPSAQKPRINEALAALAKNRKALREAQLPGQDWIRHAEALEKARADKKKVEEELAGKERRRNRLERIRDALPVIARRRELLHSLASFSSAVILPEGFVEKRSELTSQLRVGQNSREEAVRRMATIEQQMAGLTVAETLIGNSELIEEIYRQLGSQHKAAKDRVQLDTRRNLLRGEAKEILRNFRDDLTLERAGELRIKKSDAVRIGELGARYERLVTRMETAREDIPGLSAQMAAVEKELQGLPASRETEALENALEAAAELGALENQCRSEATEIEAAGKQLEAEARRQGSWTGSAEALEALSVPSAEAIALFEDRAAESDRSIAAFHTEIRKLDQAMADLERRIGALRLEGDIPSEQDLVRAREKRDEGWQLVLQTLEGMAPGDEAIRGFTEDLPPSVTLPEAYDIRVRRADAVADRLRREADRVALMAGLLAEQEGQRKQSEQLKTALAEERRKQGTFSEEWAGLWRPSGVSPRSPREMRAWLQEHQALVLKATEIRRRRLKNEGLQTRLEAHRKAVGELLQSLCEPGATVDETLAAMIRRGKRTVERERKLANHRGRLTDQKARLEEALTEAQRRIENSEKELSSWQRQWERAVRPLGLGVEALPAEANAVMEDLKALFDKLKEADDYGRRIYGIDCDSREFEEKVARLTEHVARDLQGGSAQKAAVELNSRLTRARSAQSQQKALAEQLRREETLIGKTAIDLVEMEARLQAMCEEAGCQSPDELPEAERRSGIRRQIESDVQAMDERLRELSAGATVEEFIAQASGVDGDGLGAEIRRLEEDIRQLHGTKSVLDQTIGQEQNELAKMDGSARAAELAQESQTLLGALENDVEHYARLQIAARLLARAAERFRDKNQGPILKRTSSIFARLTGGSFEGVRAEFDQQGEPILVGVRPGGKETVAVEGMSDGTADQLYLALRLGGLEEYLKKNEPIPFVVDDVLIKFDDGRAVAALQALAELSKRTQVIFFTHHRHLVHLAQRSVHASVLVEHDLTA